MAGGLTSNVFTMFRKLLPSDALLVGEVTAHNADGTSTVDFPGATTGVRVRGTTVSVGGKAFCRGGEIVGEAPDLTAYEVTV